MSDDEHAGKAFIRKKGGRPPILTDELQRKICEALELGAYMETAAAYAGVNKDTFYDWLKKGARNPKTKFGKFSDAVSKAIAKGEMLDVAAIVKARSKNWQAAAWKLQRRHPTRWAPSHRGQVAGDDGGDDESQNEFKLNYSLDDDEGP